MRLSEKLQPYLDGWVVNLEQGAFMGVFIGQLAYIEETDTWVELTVIDSQLFRLNGMLVDVRPSYTISWNPTIIKPFVPIEGTTKLTTHIPYVQSTLVFYQPGTDRPDLPTALRDLRSTRYI